VVTAQSRPLERSSTASQVAQCVRGQIARGELAPGDRIVELNLARDLGVSRSPIREALGQLELEGLVESIPYRGAYVRRLDAVRFRQLLEFRLALEEFAVRRLARCIDATGLERLRSALERIAERARASDFEGAIAADLSLHEMLVELAGNEPLRGAYRAMINEFRLYIRLTSRHYASIAELASEHDDLLRALEARKPSGAALALRRHIVHGVDDVLEELS